MFTPAMMPSSVSPPRVIMSYATFTPRSPFADAMTTGRARNAPGTTAFPPFAFASAAAASAESFACSEPGIRLAALAAAEAVRKSRRDGINGSCGESSA